MRYYVYILLDPRVKGCYDNSYCSVNMKPFYIGKGDLQCANKFKRHLLHYKLAAHDSEASFKTNPKKHRTIRKLIDEGFGPQFKIAFRTDDESEAFQIEKELIFFYGKDKDGGLLSNIADGGFGGNTIDNVEGLKEKLRKIASDKWSGEGNPNYKKKLTNSFSHIAKMNGNHWNKGSKMPNKTKTALREMRHKNVSRVVRVDPITLKDIEIMDSLKALEIYLKPNIKSQLYRAIHEGGMAGGFLWRKEGCELILNKTKREGYKAPIRKSKIRKKVFYKKDEWSDEVMFIDIDEASIHTGICAEVIRRKCKMNNTISHFFRWENESYKFQIKKGHKRGVLMTDFDGTIIPFESLTSAAKHVGASISAVLAVCAGKRKTCKKRQFKYVD